MRLKDILYGKGYDLSKDFMWIAFVLLLLISMLFGFSIYGMIFGILTFLQAIVIYRKGRSEKRK